MMRAIPQRASAYGSGNPAAAPANPTPGDTLISIWGQSNAVGRADQTDISASPLSADPGLATYASGPFDRVFVWTGSAFVALNLAAGNNGAAAGQFGPEFGLAVRWMRQTTAGNLYITKEASSGVSITYFDPTNWIYGGMATRESSAKSWIASHGGSLANHYWLWIQGEADAAQTQSWYQTRMADLIAARATSGLDTSKQILVQMHPSSASYGAGVAAAKAAIAAGNPSVVTAPTMPYYMKSDNLHANGRGQVQMAYNAAESYFGWPHINA